MTFSNLPAVDRAHGHTDGYADDHANSCVDGHEDGRVDCQADGHADGHANGHPDGRPDSTYLMDSMSALRLALSPPRPCLMHAFHCQATITTRRTPQSIINKTFYPLQIIRRIASHTTILHIQQTASTCLAATHACTSFNNIKRTTILHHTLPLHSLSLRIM